MPNQEPASAWIFGNSLVSRYPGALSPVLEIFRRALSPNPTDCPWVCEDERGLGRVLKQHVHLYMKKSIEKEWFYGIYLKIKQLKVGHNVIMMKLECHINWFSTTLTIEGLSEDGTLNSTTRIHYAHFLHFETHLSQKKLLWKMPLTFRFYQYFSRS